jgi:CRP-like cAMP-binding protein
MQGVDTVVSTIDQHGASFGELSLMYGKPRTATVKCTQSGWLWALDRKAFRGVLVERMAHDNLIKVQRFISTFGQRTTNGFLLERCTSTAGTM